MFQLARPLFLTCETPLHAGSGDALGVVDLPIQRERHTSFPKIEASSLKGALRESFEEKKGRSDSSLLKAFGPDEGDLNAGALGFTDARLLLFPVKSLKGVFAWITCPKALRQLSEDLSLSVQLKIKGINLVADGRAIPLSEQSNIELAGKYILEEYTFSKSTEASSLKIVGNEESAINDGEDTPSPDTEIPSPDTAEAPSSDIQDIEPDFVSWLADNVFPAASHQYWHEKIKSDIIVLSDNDFKDFVNLSTEVITRIKINNDTGTVQPGALFTEEYLPAESVLYSLVLASPAFLSSDEKKNGKVRDGKADAMMNYFTENLNKVIQLGGNATLGKGLLRTKVILPIEKQEKNG
jgi:CRISPR-associated protein Cmr4